MYIPFFIMYYYFLLPLPSHCLLCFCCNLAELDYRPIDVEVTFEIDETEKTEQILIFDDQFLEELETFSLSLEAINNLDEGAFPVVVIDELINITIIDDDGMCNFNISLPCF